MKKLFFRGLIVKILHSMQTKILSNGKKRWMKILKVGELACNSLSINELQKATYPPRRKLLILNYLCLCSQSQTAKLIRVSNRVRARKKIPSPAIARIYFSIIIILHRGFRHQPSRSLPSGSTHHHSLRLCHGQPMP